MRIEWISDLACLDAIEASWRALECAASHRTHLSTFDFLTPWYRHYAGEYGGRPLIGLAWHDTTLVGIAPLTMRRGSLGRVPITRIEFAPSDVPAGEFLVRDDRADIVAALVDSLVQSVAFDVIALDGFDQASCHLEPLRAAAVRRRIAVEVDNHAFALVHLPHGYEAYYEGLSGNTRRKINQKTRRIAAAGAGIEGGQLGEGLDTIEESIRRMIAITEASYKLQRQRLADNHRGFLTDVSRRFGARGMLSLPILSIGGRDAAFILGVVERGCFYDISLAYDGSFAQLSPGVYLMQELLRRLAAAGVHTVVSHGAHEYKRHWATAFVPQQRLFLFAPRPRAAAARFVRFGLQPLWRRFTVPEAASDEAAQSAMRTVTPIAARQKSKLPGAMSRSVPSVQDGT